MPPATRVIARYAAEPPQDGDPYGRWRERLTAEFLGAAQGLDEAGEIGELVFYPDRTWHGRTFVPVTAATDADCEVFGYVVFVAPGEEGDEPYDFTAFADFTDDTAANNPDWQLDICDQVIGRWRGEGAKIAAMTLVWGRTLVSGGAVVTAELGNLAVDQCTLVDDRFTLIAADNYGGDLLELKLFSDGGDELAGESLYDEDDD